jgi:hypothetical protein
VDEREPSGAVEQVAARPALVPVQPPDLVVRVERDRVGDLEALDGPRDGVAIAPE